MVTNSAVSELTLLLPEEHTRELEAAAKAAGLTIAQLLRRLVEEFLYTRQVSTRYAMHTRRYRLSHRRQ